MPQPARFSCALITGASSGLGEQFALQLAPRVDKLVLVARREPLLQQLAERIRALHPEVEVLVQAADLTDSGDRDDLVENLILQRCQPDLLVNNAGLGDYGEFVSSDWVKLRSMLCLNIEALTHLTHAMLPAMLSSRRAAIVNVSSLASLLPLPDLAVYAATKAYVTSFSEALRIELRDHHIPVLAVCPGPVKTEFGEVARRHGEAREMPGHHCFYVPKQQVVAEALTALDQNRARVYPGLKTAAAALLIAALPIVAIRLVMSLRPRKC
ncbi:MAG: SDR family oxidoreductase [Verrucomicrobia bacterium]|nr:MAG: SDR family oxidoreductase [Verrucomicrobiota bacterium]